MKKIVASVGLVAIGAAGIQTAGAQSLGVADTSKPWSVSATLRGFYDDNTSTLPNNTPPPAGSKRDSFGFEVSPSAALVWSVEQTTISLGVLYSLKYYDHKPIGSTDHSDQVFTFSGSLSHSFNDQMRLHVSDSFIIGQEPDMLRAGNTFSTFQRLSGDNIRNFGSIGFDDQITPQFGLGLGYDNGYYDYKASGASFDPASGMILASPAGALNRLEHRGHIEGTYQLQPETKALIGYQFTEIDFTGNEFIGGSGIFLGPIFIPTSRFVSSRERNSREHTGYLGLEHNFTPELVGSVRVGASHTDYYNDSSVPGNWTPYVNADIKYTYAPESFVRAGFSYDRNATDVIGYNGAGSGTFALDAESAVIFASINHRFMPNLFGSVMGQFQNSSYHGGTHDSQDEQYYMLGVDLEYRFNQYLSTHVGYNYDRLESKLGRTFDRNRIYVGVTATY